jgi:hypothetical protein
VKAKRAAIYTRVSTTDQHPEMQEKELRNYVASRRNWTIHRIYCDKGVSGAVEKRPSLDAMMNDCRRRKVEVVIVWKFDRFARSLKQLLNALELFRELGIGFVSCTEAIDTSLPHGEMLLLCQKSCSQGHHRLKSAGKVCGKRYCSAKPNGGNEKRWGNQTGTTTVLLQSQFSTGETIRARYSQVLQNKKLNLVPGGGVYFLAPRFFQ